MGIRWEAAFAQPSGIAADGRYLYVADSEVSAVRTIVRASNGFLYVADTYNHTLKVLSPRTRTASTLFGTGRPGLADGAPGRFSEPGGLWVAQGCLWVADTNNHAVRVADLSLKQVRILSLSGLSAR